MTTLTAEDAHNGADAQAELAWRVTGLVNLYRILATAGLFILVRLPITAGLLKLQHPDVLMGLCLLHFGAGAGLVLFPRERWGDLQRVALLHVAVDSLGFGSIVWAAGGISSGLGILLVLPVGAMSLLAESPHRSQLMASMAALALLLQQAATHLAGHAGTAEYLAAGLLGGVLFIAAIGARPLGSRLRESEARVRRQEVDIENLALLSQYIVQHLRESLLVIDAEDRIRLINESAAGLLGESMAVRGTLLGEVSPHLLYLASTWRQGSGLPAAAGETLLASDGLRVLQPHFVQIGQDRQGPALVFLEDTSLIAKKVQQTKLAALGRLSASIAHEIRNPVGAMSHAAQLLAESPSLSEDDRRLTQIMTGNASRVSRLIESMLEFSRRGRGTPVSIDLAGWLERFREEFCATLQVPVAKLNILALPQAADAAPLVVRGDPTQLHQIVWNLCQNALTHGDAMRDSARIDISFGRMPASNRPYLEVADRGPGVPPELRERAFEPFFTTSGEGTGLGLFLSRELAQSNDAALQLEDREGGGSLLRLVFSDPLRWSA